MSQLPIKTVRTSITADQLKVLSEEKVEDMKKDIRNGGAVLALFGVVMLANVYSDLHDSRGVVMTTWSLQSKIMIGAAITSLFMGIATVVRPRPSSMLLSLVCAALLGFWNVFVSIYAAATNHSIDIGDETAVSPVIGGVLGVVILIACFVHFTKFCSVKSEWNAFKRN